ncbi:MAG TPA: hypothetical protein PLI95_04255 [Polyangiaceae bacterium]|nr:hypothetical protein [Polyangiaceae bacterium]
MKSSHRVQRSSWIALAALAAACTSCSRSTPAGQDASPLASATAAVSSSPAKCVAFDALASVSCRNGKREVDRIPEDAQQAFVLSHCPLDDCGSGGCTYDVYEAEGACLRGVGSVHGASFDVAAPGAGAPPALRTWGRSGTTHVVTEYELADGKLVKRRQFVCDYGSGKPMPEECPKM